MSQRLHYAKAVNGPALLEQLQAAIPTIAPVVGTDGLLHAVMMLEATPTDVWVTVPDGVASAAVDAVVAAHDASVLSLEQQQASSDQTDVTTFPTRAQVLAALSQLNTDLTTLSGTPTNAQLVAILNRTVTNQRAIIKALAVLVRRQGG